MAQLAIRGHATRGKEVIEILEMLGGKNINRMSGDMDGYVYIINHSYKGEIDCFYAVSNVYKVFTLEEFLKKFPYKVGDRVIDKIDGCIGIVTEMCWEEHTSCVKYCVTFGGGVDFGWYSAQSLQPYKEETMEERENSVVVNIEHKQLKVHSLMFDKTQLMINDEYELKQEGDAYYIVRKKPQYPKTYEECCELLFPNSIALGKVLTSGYNCELLERLGKLLICRDAYWKIAGDWKPYNNEKCYSIFRYAGEIVKGEVECYGNSLILEFPTEEMRDAFYENFKDLIEQCKELI